MKITFNATNKVGVVAGNIYVREVTSRFIPSLNSYMVSLDADVITGENEIGCVKFVTFSDNNAYSLNVRDLYNKVVSVRATWNEKYRNFSIESIGIESGESSNYVQPLIDHELLEASFNKYLNSNEEKFSRLLEAISQLMDLDEEEFDIAMICAIAYLDTYERISKSLTILPDSVKPVLMLNLNIILGKVWLKQKQEILEMSLRLAGFETSQNRYRNIAKKIYMLCEIVYGLEVGYKFEGGDL